MLVDILLRLFGRFASRDAGSARGVDADQNRSRRQAEKIEGSVFGPTGRPPDSDVVDRAVDLAIEESRIQEKEKRK